MSTRTCPREHIHTLIHTHTHTHARDRAHARSTTVVNTITVAIKHNDDNGMAY